MREYHITFTCKDQDYNFGISMLIPNTEKALRPMILAQIVDIKKANDLEEYPATNIRVKYSEDGKKWYSYAFFI